MPRYRFTEPVKIDGRLLKPGDAFVDLTEAEAEKLGDLVVAVHVGTDLAEIGTGTAASVQNQTKTVPEPVTASAPKSAAKPAAKPAAKRAPRKATASAK